MEISKTDAKRLINTLMRSAMVIRKYTTKPREADKARMLVFYANKIKDKLKKEK